MKSSKYKVIYDIFAIANLFSMNGVNNKNSEQIGNRLLPQNWESEIKKYSYKLLQEMYDTIDFGKICKTGRSYTVYSGQYMARRYYNMMGIKSKDDLVRYSLEDLEKMCPKDKRLFVRLKKLKKIQG